MSNVVGLETREMPANVVERGRRPRSQKSFIGGDPAVSQVGVGETEHVHQARRVFGSSG
jgi:hypothetical protein